VSSQRSRGVVRGALIVAALAGACTGSRAPTPIGTGLAELEPVGQGALRATAGFGFHSPDLSGVEVNIQAGSIGTGLQAAVYDGSCEAPGSLVVSIGAIEGPQLFTDIAAGEDELVGRVVVLSGLGSDEPLACGPIEPVE
jgi:hypothetical protein